MILTSTLLKLARSGASVYEVTTPAFTLKFPGSPNAGIPDRTVDLPEVKELFATAILARKAIERGFIAGVRPAEVIPHVTTRSAATVAKEQGWEV